MPERVSRYKAAESNFTSIGNAAKAFADKILSVVVSIFHFMKLFFKEPLNSMASTFSVVVFSLYYSMVVMFQSFAGLCHGCRSESLDFPVELSNWCVH